VKLVAVQLLLSGQTFPLSNSPDQLRRSSSSG
jgi:hypothetical protein